MSYVGLESVNPVPDSFEMTSTLNTNGTTQTVEVAGLSPYSWYIQSISEGLHNNSKWSYSQLPGVICSMSPMSIHIDTENLLL